MGFLQRGGKVKTEVIANRKKKTLHGMVRGKVSAGSALYTDALASYDGLDGEFFHQVVDHAVEFAHGRVHTNGLENFWRSVKRALKVPKAVILKEESRERHRNIRKRANKKKGES